MRKFYIPTVFLAGGWLVFLMSSQSDAEFSLMMSARYDTFYDDLSPGTDGFEITVPIRLTYTHEPFSLRLHSAYSHATLNLNDDSDSELSSVTDTLVSASYILDIPQNDFALIAGIDANLPTGKEQLNEQERRVEVGEDHNLFLVEDFGEGFNVGLSLGLGMKRESFNASLYGSYIFKNTFDPTNDASDDEFDPGDEAAAIVVLNWNATSLFSIETFVSYTYSFSNTMNGEEDFREGDQITVGSEFRVNLQRVELALNVQSIFQQKNEELVNGHLEQEPENSNSIKIFVTPELAWTISQKASLQLKGDFRYYTESDRIDTLSGQPYYGQQLRYAAGPGFQYVVNNHLTWSGWAEYFLINQDSDLSLEQDVTFQGMNVEIGGQVTW